MLKIEIAVRYFASGSSNAGWRGLLKHLSEMDK